ncbi:uncharacterized protein BcabD6B2_03270 [Babesia caballi]|uniref:Uncharacterized protein n=1 Tax=Babesia caballi TaxID=5871 RepID=A0AAV4LLC4_BABCB|nr:hypothetical protein, conserved [Babesia caballi]
MRPGIRAFYYTCKACNREISHNVALNLIAGKIHEKKPLLPATDAAENHCGKDAVSKSQLEEARRARLQQQLYGPTTAWMTKQREAALSENFKRVVNMLNRGQLQCPNCNSKGAWAWNCCAVTQ